MGWGTLQNLGTVTGNSGTISLTSLSVPAGSLIVAANAMFSNAGASFSDSNSDSFLNLATATDGAGVTANYTYNNSATVTSISKNTNSFSSILAAIAIPGEFTSSAPLDQTNNGTGTGTAVSSGSITPTQPGEFVIGVVAFKTAASVTQPGGWTSITTGVTFGGIGLAAAYLIDAGTTAETYNPTLNLSGAWYAIVGSFLVAPSGVFVPSLKQYLRR